MACVFASIGAVAASALQLETDSAIQLVDAAVKARIDGILGYTATEHYAVYRNNDETHPVAEMTVKTTYRKETGKSYAIVSQSGSEIIRTLVLGGILDKEKRVNEPGTREGAWLVSANYEMKLKQSGTERLDGRDCLLLAVAPRRKAPHLIEGTLWVDAKDGLIVQLEGTMSESSSVFTGPTRVMRQYANVNGFSEARHARAESNSFLFGRTIVKIDYQDYQIQLRPAQ